MQWNAKANCAGVTKFARTLSMQFFDSSNYYQTIINGFSNLHSVSKALTVSLKAAYCLGMTGLTTEIESISEALDKIHSQCVETYGKGPEKFFLGFSERNRLWKETERIRKFSAVDFSDSYLGIPIQVIEGVGIDFKAPRYPLERG